MTSVPLTQYNAIKVAVIQLWVISNIPLFPHKCSVCIFCCIFFFALCDLKDVFLQALQIVLL